MKNGLFVGLIAIVAALALAVLLGVGSYITYANLGNSTETSLFAKYEDNKQILGKHATQIREMAQVNAMYADDMTELYTGVVEGRYGEDGSRAMMQWIQEHAPAFDSTLYTRLSQRIEANRNEFTTEQTILLDRKRSYEILLGNVWSGFWLRVAGYPKKDLNTIVIVTSSHASNAFKTGIDDGVDITTTPGKAKQSKAE